jgi:NitT/TauT family transport system ATP-binding protein
MQQRVAIIRALVCQPKILLMDEPFGSLDALSRSELEDDLLRLWKKFNITILFVTHDIDEAIYLSDRIIVMSSNPSEIADIFDINLPRPRHQINSRNLKIFSEYRAEISKLLGRGIKNC